MKPSVLQVCGTGIGLILCLTPMLHAEDHKTVSFPDPNRWQAAEIKPYIGETITFAQPLYVCYNYNRHYDVSLRRVFIPTNQYLPLSAEYEDCLKINMSPTLTLTGIRQYHRCGEKIYNLKAYVSSASTIEFIDGEWVGNTRSELQNGIDLNQIDKNGKHSLLVCAMNLEYYLTDNLTNDGFGPSSDAEHQKQRAKISKALATINADIYALSEIQQGQNALKEIAQDLTANTGRTFTCITDATSVNGSYTKVGYVYCSQTVTPYGTLQENNTATYYRKYIQSFTEKASGERFLLSLNHFKAKSGTASGDDRDQGDGQGSFNKTRVKEAQSVLQQYNRIYRSYNNDKDILIVGDLNAYAKENPVTTFTDNDMIDLHRYFCADSSYSYVFQAQAGYLDHAICNTSLLPQITGLYVYHINSDESDEFTYDKSDDTTMFRSSDHDPLIIGLRPDSQATLVKDITINNFDVWLNQSDIVIYNANLYTDKACCALFAIDGRQIYNSAFTPIPADTYTLPRPELPGMYILIIYINNKEYPFKLII